MDFHPLVIHYPIAFLTTYAVFELLRSRKIVELPYWFYIKAALVTIGEMSAIVTFTAAMISNTLSVENRLVEMYKLFMLSAAIIFGIITLVYIYEWRKSEKYGSIPQLGSSTSKFIVLLAISGFFFIVIAGGFFGATVYGTQFDPYLAPVFKLLKVY